MANDETLCSCSCGCINSSFERDLLPEDDVEVITSFFKALSNPTRFNIVYALLRKQQLSVGEVAAHANVSISAASHQLATLRLNNLVKVKRIGNKNLYALCDDHVAKVIEMAIEHSKE